MGKIHNYMLITQMECIYPIPKIRFKNKKDIKFKTKYIGRAFETDSELVYFEKKYRENLNMDDYKIENGSKEKFITGCAGSGKTTRICEMIKDCKKPMIFAFTNKAIENVKQKLLINNEISIEESSKFCFTFDSYFCEWNHKEISNLKNNTIFIEEFSMVPNKWITKIYELYTLYNNTIYFFGDPNQCDPVENSSIHFNYELSKQYNKCAQKQLHYNIMKIHQDTI